MIRIAILSCCIVLFGILSGCSKKHSKDINSRFNFKDANSVYVYSVDPIGCPERCVNLNRGDIRKVEFNLDLFKELIQYAIYKNPTINKPLWMGGRLAIVNFNDGTKLHLAISIHGSSFRILDEDGIYTFAENPEISMKWWNEFHARILRKEFLHKSSDGKAPD